MYLVILDPYQIEDEIVVCGLYSSFEKAKEEAVKLAKSAAIHVSQSHTGDRYVVYRFTVNKTLDTSRPARMGHAVVTSSSRVLWVKGNAPKIKEPDDATKLAYDLLNRDPIAMDMMRDMLKQ